MKQLRSVLLAGLVILMGLSWVSGLASVHAQGAPAVKVIAPANGATVNNPVTITVQTSGAVIKAAAENDPNASHLHYFVDRDPATVLQQGQPIPSGQPDIIHTPDTTELLPALAPGRHTVWVVLAHTDHTPFNPNVQDQVSFVVGGGAQAAAPAAPPQVPVTGRGGLLPSAQSGGALPGPLQAVVGRSMDTEALPLAAIATGVGAALVWVWRRRTAGRR